MLELLLDEINKIKTPEIHKLVKTIVDKTPLNSWIKPSSLYHHMPDECLEWGNLIHTLRVCDICDIFSDVMNYDQIEKDKLKASAILHDCCKFDKDGNSIKIINDHAQVAADCVIETGIGTSEEYDIYTNVRLHMGRREKTKPGETPLNWNNFIFSSNDLDAFILHCSDAIEANLSRVLR
jgi:hypothetical protein